MKSNQQPEFRMCAFALALAIAGNAPADTITTVDGARLTGKIVEVTQETVQLETTYAGVIKVAAKQIATMEAERLTARFADGTTVTGAVQLDQSRALHVRGEGERGDAGLDSLLAAWTPGTTPPAASGLEAPRHWVYTVGADLAGRSGNSDDLGINLAGAAMLVTKVDELRFHASYQRGEQNSVKTADELIAGTSYTAFFRPDLGWYVRGAIERDEFEDIDLRTTAAAGLAWRPIETKLRSLRWLFGIGYRYESFDNGTSSDSPTLDLGVQHRWQLNDTVTMRNELLFSPQFKDFGNYLLTHDSALEMPVGKSRWTLRIGLRNDYKSEPAPGRKKLDTLWYTRLALRFD
jgi:putative salt-induced outer membrane protein YdiY